MFRSHIRWRPQRHANAREIALARAACFLRRGSRDGDRLRDPEVSHDGGSAREEHVFRLDVAVHNPFSVRVRERPGDVLENPECFPGSDLSPPRQPIAQRLSANVGHHIIRKLFRLTGGKQRDDIRLLQSRCESNLPGEPFDGETVREIRSQHFDDDLSAQRQLLSQKHPRHTAAAELARECITSTERVGEQRHQLVRFPFITWLKGGRNEHRGPLEEVVLLLARGQQ